MKTIHIFYSHYNIEKTDHKNRPDWFDYEQCFLSLLNSIKYIPQINLHMIMDGKISTNWINKYSSHFIPHEIIGGNMTNVTIGLFNIIKSLNLNEDDLVYILENDYLHTKNWVQEINNLYSEFDNLNYISLYDHMDKYILHMYEDLTSKIYVTSTSHWRSTPSTCGSFITTVKLLLEDFNVHIGADIPIGDHHKWLYLNKSAGRFILTPMPGLSTHCMQHLLSPCIDWKSISLNSK